MSNDDGKLVIPIPGRTIERSKGCWNCKHWNGDPEFIRPRYRALRAQAVARMRFIPKAALQRIAGALPTDPRFFRRVGDAMARGLPEEQAIQVALDAERPQASGLSPRQSDKLAFFDEKIKSGKMGICTTGAVDSHFVEDGHLCHLWSGRSGHSLAKLGTPLEDTLPDETRDVIDGRAKKV